MNGWVLLFCVAMLAPGVPAGFGQNGTSPEVTAAPESAPLPPTFAVASIRLSAPDAGLMYPPEGSAENFGARMASVESMIGFAYDIPAVLGMSADLKDFFLPQPRNMIGAPGWVSTDKYDLTAKADDAVFEAMKKLPAKEQQKQLRRMMQALLADRFKLKVRHETREMPVYALVVAKNGPKFKPTAAPPAALNDAGGPSKPYENPWRLDRGQVVGHGVTVSGLLDVLWMQRELGSRKILDRTNLVGRYDLSLNWDSVDDVRDTTGLSLFTAIQEQLGLKLEPTRAPADVLVIDHIERPSQN